MGREEPTGGDTGGAYSAQLGSGFERGWRERGRATVFLLGMRDEEEPTTSVTSQPNSQACNHSGARRSEYKVFQ